MPETPRDDCWSAETSSQRPLRTQDRACLNNQSIHQKEIIFKVKSCLHDEQQNINPNRCVGGNGKSEAWKRRLLKANEVPEK